jgi:hypothetical protein
VDQASFDAPKAAVGELLRVRPDVTEATSLATELISYNSDVLYHFAPIEKIDSCWNAKSIMYRNVTTANGHTEYHLELKNCVLDIDDLRAFDHWFATVPSHVIAFPKSEDATVFLSLESGVIRYRGGAMPERLKAVNAINCRLVFSQSTDTQRPNTRLLRAALTASPGELEYKQDAT